MKEKVMPQLEYSAQNGFVYIYNIYLYLYITLHLGVSRGCEKTVEALMKEKVMPQLEYSAQNGFVYIFIYIYYFYFYFYFMLINNLYLSYILILWGCEKTVEALMKEKVMPQLEYSAQNGFVYIIYIYIYIYSLYLGVSKGVKRRWKR